MYKIETTEWKEAFRKLEDHRQTVIDLIQPFLVDDLTVKQRVELCHVGKLLSLLPYAVKIIEVRDSPDFLVSIENEWIGLEHERIMNPCNVKRIKSLRKLFDDAAFIFAEKYPGHHFLANCWLSAAKLDFKKKDVKRLTNEIADYVFASCTQNTQAEKPSYIERVFTTPHDGVVFLYNPGAFFVNRLDNETLNKAISKKESLLSKYKQNSKLEKQWLVIVIGDVSPDSYEISREPYTLDHNSKFDKVFLMEDFKGRVMEIVSTPNTV